MTFVQFVWHSGRNSQKDQPRSSGRPSIKIPVSSGSRPANKSKYIRQNFAGWYILAGINRSFKIIFDFIPADIPYNGKD
jgi:hypothetical protein